MSSVRPIIEHMVLTSPVTGDVNLDHLAKVMLAFPGEDSELYRLKLAGRGEEEVPSLAQGQKADRPQPVMPYLREYSCKGWK